MVSQPTKTCVEKTQDRVSPQDRADKNMVAWPPSPPPPQTAASTASTADGQGSIYQLVAVQGKMDLHPHSTSVVVHIKNNIDIHCVHTTAWRCPQGQRSESEAYDGSGMSRSPATAGDEGGWTW